MSNKSLQLVLIFFLYHGVLFAQTSSIKGRVMDEINNTPIAFATISMVTLKAARMNPAEALKYE